MKKSYVLFLLLFVSYVFGQTTAIDSVSGGSYHIKNAGQLDSLVYTTHKSNCWALEQRNKERENQIKAQEKEKNMDPCLKSPKVLGYKIQVMYTKDRNKANKRMTEFSSHYPNLIPERTYTAPDFRVLVGDYFTKKSGLSDLKKIQKKYPGAFFVQWRVWCRKAK